MKQVQIQKIKKAMDTAVESKDSFVAEPGKLDEELVRFISKDKNEPDWMLKKRLKALELFKKTPMPKWGPSLKKLEMDKIIFYRTPDMEQTTDWEEVPSEIKKTFDALGIPEAERKALGGTGAQFESNVIYHKLKKEFDKQGVIFEDMNVAVKKYPELVKKYFMTNCIPISDHKFIMLHAAVWSGGTFIYVPKNVKVTLPLQAYFRMNAKLGGQFEHTLIVVEAGGEVNYIEGCSAPQFGEAKALHAGGVEIYVGEGARVRYSSVENWSTSTFNLNTKRAIIEKNGIIEWVGGNMGSCTTMLYPCSILKGEGARADHLGIAYAGRNQNQDTGAKVYHIAPNTSSNIRMKSISKDGGVCTYRGLVKVAKSSKNSKVAAICDALILDKKSISNTIPDMDIGEETVQISHEASVGKLSTEKIFYLMSRGLKEEEAIQMIVTGFMEPIMKELPLEYAVELNKLIQLEMVGAVG
ncbi:Fe-S cluster assembly protein SufB [Candidatus Woesearchaeota archaeon]|nr:Fe-S cluster assembly protein SufB [Candidatus Woesearchaeota archaeon]|tara:strand:+ start:16567 stop:17973 length:1407 start_codon:yes stop_codon:yes gene_type:complete